MKIPRDWNGEELARALNRLGFTRVRQSGSHVMLRHDASGEVLSIPSHRPLKVGTLNNLLSTVAMLLDISKQQLLDKLR